MAYGGHPQYEAGITNSLPVTISELWQNVSRVQRHFVATFFLITSCAYSQSLQVLGVSAELFFISGIVVNFYLGERQG